jgi:hypothetical protein
MIPRAGYFHHNTGVWFENGADVPERNKPREGVTATAVILQGSTVPNPKRSCENFLSMAFYHDPNAITLSTAAQEHKKPHERKETISRQERYL